MDLLKSNLYLKDIKFVLASLDVSKLRNKKILITGGTGLIGSAIVDILTIAHQYKKIKFDIYVASRNERLFKNKYSSYRFVHFAKYDAIKPFVSAIKYDYIICAASPSNPTFFVKKPIDTFLANVLGVTNLLNYSLKNKVTKFIYVSSSEVYGQKHSSESFVESDASNINVNSARMSYPVAKLASEFVCNSYFNQHGLNINIVRPGHIFGPSATSNDSRVSSSFFYESLAGNDLILKSSGEQKRSYCYSLDCAAAILFLLINAKGGETYNIGSILPTSIKQISSYIAQSANVKLRFSSAKKEEKKAFNPMANSILNSSKILKLGFRFSFDCKTAADHTFKILKEFYK